MVSLKTKLILLIKMFRSADGYTLVGCSYDGTIAVLNFNEKEFGFPLSDEERVSTTLSYHKIPYLNFHILD